jgi:hypothetical protein
MNRSLFHCSLVSIELDDIRSLHFGRMLIVQRQTINIMARRLNPEIAMLIGAPSRCPCKRSFEEFATPLKEEYLPEADTARDPTIEDLIAAGGDLTTIMSSLCQLTNDIHPIFRAENICMCPYAEPYCMAPHFADHPEELVGKAKALQTTSPYIKGFKENMVTRTIFQLASRMMVHDDALPFWAGLMDAVNWEADKPNISFKVHPRRNLSKDQKKRTLEHLEEFAAEHIRFHFKARQNDDGSMWGSEGECNSEVPLEEDPLYPTCMDARVWKHYAWRDGKPIIVDDTQEFAHITINLARFLPTRPLEDLLSMTISGMKVRMFASAMTLCHELAHALERHNCDHDYFTAPAMNDEMVIETGFSFANFLHGGLLNWYSEIDGDDIYLLPWPCQVTLDLYRGTGNPMDWARLGDAGPERFLPVKPHQVHVFLEQSFWDDPAPPAGCLKKMWLGPHVELALDEDDFEYFTTGDTPPYQPQPKRRRFSDATKERQRLRRANAARKKRDAVKFRWYRSKDVSEERKEEFHEREKERLNQMWVEWTK